jgi:hypothetical protein
MGTFHVSDDNTYGSIDFTLYGPRESTPSLGLLGFKHIETNSLALVIIPLSPL